MHALSIRAIATNRACQAKPAGSQAQRHRGRAGCGFSEPQSFFAYLPKVRRYQSVEIPVRDSLLATSSSELTCESHGRAKVIARQALIIVPQGGESSLRHQRQLSAARLAERDKEVHAA